MSFLELSSLNRDQSNQLLDLQQAVHKRAHSSPLIYWHILKKPRPFPCNILAYHGKELIGFASRFLFHEGTCELSILIRPNFQTEFFAKQLLYALMKYIPNDYKEFVVMHTAHQQRPMIKPEGSWVYLYSSHRLQWTGPAKKPLLRPGFEFNKASPADFPGFKTISEIGFPQGTSMTEEIFNSIIESAGTQLWLLYHEQKVIGSIQVNQENKCYRISDITVLPEYRRQGLGNFMLISIVHQLQLRQKQIVLDVESNNETALAWYIGLGMKKINTSDFWRIPFSELIG